MAVDELVDELLAQPFDVHRAPRRVVQDRLLALRRAVEAPRAAVHRFAFDALDFGIAHRTARRHLELAASGRRCSTSTRATSGITSPARRTMTVSPTRTSLARTWSRLCSVALVTVTPPTKTGSSLATGVSAPVRPTCTSMAATVLVASSAGNLCATAKRGARATKPRRSCGLRSIHLVDDAVDVVRQPGALLADRWRSTPAVLRAPAPRCAPRRRGSGSPRDSRGPRSCRVNLGRAFGRADAVGVEREPPARGDARVELAQRRRRRHCGGSRTRARPSRAALR